MPHDFAWLRRGAAGSAVLPTVLAFLGAYFRSMRCYYSFITGVAGWIWVAYYEYLAANPLTRSIETPPSLERKLVILAILFLSWGVNQIINDYLGREEDRINAPERPMITGELHPQAALILSTVLIAAAGVVTWFYLEPIAVVFLGAGVLLNIVYERAKGYGALGNLVFGLMIAMAPLYGGYASGPTAASLWASNRVSVLLLVVVLNGVMTYYTYFKDYRGDILAGKRTLVVVFGLDRSRFLAVVSAFVPALVFACLRWTGLHRSPLNSTFVCLGALTVLMQVWTGLLYWQNPTGQKAYSSLKTNFQACVCGQAALIGLFHPSLAVGLFVVSYILVGFLFGLHRNPRG